MDNNDSWSAPSSDTSVTLTTLSEGNHFFYVKAIDEAGNEDQSPANRTWTVDLVPTILSATTTEGSPGVTQRNTNVTITFSEAMDPTTLTNSNIQLFKKGSTKPISSVVTKNAATTEVTLNPYGTNRTLLAQNTTYTVRVSIAVKDADAPITPLATPYTKNFTIGTK